MRDAYIVQALRTPGCRRNKGAFAQTRPEEMLAHVIKSVMDKTPNVPKEAVDDIMIGCAFPEAEQGLNVGRICGLMAGMPITTSGAIVNRFCSSGLEASVISAMRVMTGFCDVAMGGGLECMSTVPMGGNMPRPNPDWAKENPDVYISMGITAENVASRYNITREQQDIFGYHSQMKAVNALKNGLFPEIVPTEATKFVTKDGMVVKETFMQDWDDGIREATTLEGMAKLRPAFKAGGSVTAANSSQTTDGAAANLIMSEEACREYGVTPMVKIVSYAVAGVEPDEMGVGPAAAIPKLLKQVGWDLKDLGTKVKLIELNEAFASQSIYCAQQLGIDAEENWSVESDKRFLNVNGGAIALGHPLGCTGAKLLAQIVHNMYNNNVKYGIESMCIGGGMGAACLFELVDDWK